MLVDPETVRLADSLLDPLVAYFPQRQIEGMRVSLAERIQEAIEEWFGTLERPPMDPSVVSLIEAGRYLQHVRGQIDRFRASNRAEAV